MKEGQMVVQTGNYISISILRKNEITLISLSEDRSLLALSVNVTSSGETKLTLGSGMCISMAEHGQIDSHGCK